jgi:polyvinyl alcohol dehydrogenase (cytochrome)
MRGFQINFRLRGLAAAAALVGLTLLGAAAGRAGAQAAAPSAKLEIGEGLYRVGCAACHDNPEASRAPSLATLKAMRFQTITYALTEGKMKAIGAGMSAAERTALASWLTGRDVPVADTWTAAMTCPTARKAVNLKGPVTIATFGFDRANSRSLTARQAGLTKAQLGNMELAWAIAFPGATTMRAQPAVVGDNLFLPVADAGAMYAFDISDPKKPCLQWTYQTPGGAPLRTSAAYGIIKDGTPVLAFSGLDSRVYLLDARTGKPLWTKLVGSYKYSLTTGTPTVTRNRIIVPVAQYEISVGAQTHEACCNNHGYVLSLDPRTGAQQWRYDTMEDAKPVRDRGDGKMLEGPSGAPIWNSPVVDEKRGLIYFGTGESNSPPAHRNTDALIAIRLADGKEAWSHQATADDIFLSGCGPNPKPTQLNCVKDTVYRDVDFGASLILGRLSDGREVLFAGQKSGTVWALDPATGKLVWRRDIGTGGALGGIHWGIAYDKDTIYAAITNPGRSLPNQTVGADIKPGVYAVDGKSGAIKWAFHNKGDCPPPPQPGRFSPCERGLGMSTATTVIDGAVIQGALDGGLHIIDAADGREMWKFETAQSFPTLNGVPGKGGAIDAASVTAGGGLLFVNSGYGMFGQIPGNLFLAFKPKGR